MRYNNALLIYILRLLYSSTEQNMVTSLSFSLFHVLGGIYPVFIYNGIFVPKTYILTNN